MVCYTGKGINYKKTNGNLANVVVSSSTSSNDCLGEFVSAYVCMLKFYKNVHKLEHVLCFRYPKIHIRKMMLQRFQMVGDSSMKVTIALAFASVTSAILSMLLILKIVMKKIVVQYFNRWHSLNVLNIGL